MTLLELYQKKLQQMEYFLNKARNTTDFDVSDSFYSHAVTCQQKASSLAHCLAMFGDQDLEAMPIEQLGEQVAERTCADGNPWVWGLNIIAQERGS